MNPGPATQGSVRAVARSAVTDRLTDLALSCILERGYDAVTLSELATAAGVSRSTFIRYVGSKDNAVLGAMEVQRARLVENLRTRPAEEQVWAALRHALGEMTIPNRDHPTQTLALTRLIQQTPALLVGFAERKDRWAAELADVLAMRAGAAEPGIAESVLSAAALDCLSVATARWSRSDNEQELDELLNEAFRVIAPRA